MFFSTKIVKGSWACDVGHDFFLFLLFLHLCFLHPMFLKHIKILAVTVTVQNTIIDSKIKWKTNYLNSVFCMLSRKNNQYLKLCGVSNTITITICILLFANVQQSKHPSRKNLSIILHDALWAYRTVYKTPLGMSPYIFVYGNACHFPIELEYKVMWAMKKLNLNLGKSSRHRMLPLLELEEFRIEAYESAQIYKSKVKKRLDARIQNREFKLGEKVLLFDSRLKLFPRKLKS